MKEQSDSGMKNHNRIDVDRGIFNRFTSYHELMRYRIRDILMVSSLYDTFTLGEEGVLYELLVEDYMGLNLSHPPDIRRVSRGQEALDFIESGGHCDLIVTSLHLEDMHALKFAGRVREAGIKTPLVLLTYDNRELTDLTANHDLSGFDRVFLWQGNFRILLAIIKCIEDMQNVERDTKLVGVQSIILIEDNVKFYSSYLPIIYTQLMLHSQRVIAEGINLAHKMLRMRARPKILLCESYDEAWRYFEKYHETVLGVISDISFPRHGVRDRQAGIQLAREVKKSHEDIPILLQSNNPDMKPIAQEIGASFLLKNSPRLLHKLQAFMKQYFSFDDFVFCLPDGREVGRARDLHELEEMLHTVPEESLLYHAERNHFSNWLKARTEFYLAHLLRPRKVSDYASTDDIRQALITYLHDYHIAQHRDAIADFDAKLFDPRTGITRLGGGSLGGKGRGLAFMNTLINASRLQEEFPDITISVPPTVILETDVFDAFLEDNDLGDFALNVDDEREIVRRFLYGVLPAHIVKELRGFLAATDYPLAVRSSGLFEDSQHVPFAGVYETFMLANNHPDIDVRLNELMAAIKRVYASTFSNHAKAYFKATPYRLEEEKMAVIIQKLVGVKHENRFYPDVSGVARSYNFYPIDPMTPEDGIVSAALGLGTMVVEGGLTARFCPRYPRRQVQFSSIEDNINYSQREFYTLDLSPVERSPGDAGRTRLLRLGLDMAEADDVLGAVASTYSAENDTIYDGISRRGLRLVSLAPMLKHDYFPLAAIIQRVLDLGRRGMSAPVEIEFSVNLSVPPENPREFQLLQLRPMVVSQEQEQLQLNDVPDDRLLCRSVQVLGNGQIEGIRDIVFVDRESFDRKRTVEIAREVATFNLEMTGQGRPYLLIGIGRWGSADPWLGIPVEWDEISGARAIVETGFTDMKVTPSQGTHFFQNLNAFEVGYFTVNIDSTREFIDWHWLTAQSPKKAYAFTRHIRLETPLTVRMDGHSSSGIILKPDGE